MCDLRCFLLDSTEGVGCSFFSFPLGNETLCVFDCNPVSALPCRNVEKVRDTLHELCRAVGLEIVPDGSLIISQVLAAQYLAECAWARTGEACAGEITGCAVATECQSFRAKLEEEAE